MSDIYPVPPSPQPSPRKRGEGGTPRSGRVTATESQGWPLCRAKIRNQTAVALCRASAHLPGMGDAAFRSWMAGYDGSGVISRTRPVLRELAACRQFALFSAAAEYH
jgi:hypothetical protein